MHGHHAHLHEQHHEDQAWLDRQTKSRLPATYFMATFTLQVELPLGLGLPARGGHAADGMRLVDAQHL